MGRIEKDKYGDGFTYHRDDGSSEHFEKRSWGRYEGNWGTNLEEEAGNIVASNGYGKTYYVRNGVGDYVESFSIQYDEYLGSDSSEYVPMKWYEYFLGMGDNLLIFPEKLSILQLIVTVVAILICFILGKALFEERSYYSMVTMSGKFHYIIMAEVFAHVVLAKKMAAKWFYGLNVWIALAEYLLWHFYMVNLITNCCFALIRPLLKVLLYCGPLNMALTFYFYLILTGPVKYLVGLCAFWSPVVAFLCQRSAGGTDEFARKVILGIVIFLAICMTIYTLISLLAIKDKFQPRNEFDDYRL